MLTTTNVKVAVLMATVGLSCTWASANDAKHVQNEPLDQQKNSTTDGNAVPTKENTLPDAGTVEGHTYKNASIGVEFTVPENLEFAQPGKEGGPNSVQHTVTVSASAKAHNKFSLQKYIVDEAIMFVADGLTDFPQDQRTDEGVMRVMSRRVEADKFKRIDGPATEKIGDVNFLRGNFVQGKRHHTLLVTTRKDYAYVFMFISNDAASADELIRSIILKFSQ